MSSVRMAGIMVFGLAAAGSGADALGAATAAAVPVAPAAAAAPATPALPVLAAAEIVNRNVVARGGLEAWKAVQTMSWKGKMGAGGTRYAVVTPKGQLQEKQREETQLPFTLEFKRPLKVRLELEFNGKTAVQVYDGANGWKYRPYLGRDNWDAFTPEELNQAAMAPGIDGFLIDYAAKGAKVESVGTDTVEGHAAYRLKVTRKDGQVRSVWVDGQSFLDLKVDGEPRKLDGKPHAVAVYLRDYKRDQGLMIPHLQETVVQGVKGSEKITIETVTVNPPLDDARFTKPK
jgi:outer membrane lipoprotein-sorting protein